MQETAERLRQLINSQIGTLKLVSEAEASVKPSPQKWSKKEILGHLIDSATNNQTKFVKTMETGGQDLPGYHQDEWVELQAYQKANWLQLIDLWRAINLHLAHLIENTPESTLQNTLTIENAGPFTLEFIMKDYIEHTKHHLLQILPDAGLTSTFKMVY
ncbi:DinB family protein [Jiulongibacter sediminis]|uniref:DinB-like domain-containing protein n=1 Tax=Jiulongibacter sediminis TaxID=1605367 RepID=A0A0P7C6L5_9BACT|nr:DinB family protein [Jiulongibacter sediminis]KPM49040.1 hypothetical protein AFM12_08710 [Jiulongibacter sediminis]TBX25554.1 hypothetical protein TK44_08715 [Jiulongibacter sediminis]